MPFIGGWVGYTYAPVEVVEVERVGEGTGPSNLSNDTIKLLTDIFSAKPGLEWNISHATTSIDNGATVKTGELVGVQLNAATPTGSGAFDLHDTLYELWGNKYEMLVNADGLPARDWDVYKINDMYVSVKMDIIFRDFTQDELISVDPNSYEAAFGVAEKVVYRVFISEPI